MKKFALLCLSVFLLASCKTAGDIKEQAVNCRYTLAQAQVVDYSASDVTLDIAVLITNTSKKTEANLNRFEGKLYVNDTDLGLVKFPDAMIPAGATVPVKTTLKVSLETVGKNIAGLVIMNSISMRYKIIGKMYFDTSLGQLPMPVVIEQKIEE
ncbi:MAG: hypothetical protein LBM71_05120 [Elusimicrobiota bacterium]|nr:hypothetical protein [Elusimicrobiota bacterium]